MDKRFKQALADVEPGWRAFDFITSVPQLCWEFVRRNPGFIRESERVEQIIAKELAEKQELLNSVAGDDEFFRLMFQGRIEQEALFHPDALKVAKKYGLAHWQSPRKEFIPDVFWDMNLKAKERSEQKLEAAFDRKSRSVNDLYLSEDEELVIVNFNVPYQKYAQEINERYKQRDAGEDGPVFQIRKYIDYIKVYDLRRWGEQGSRKVRKKGKLQSCINWGWIAEYLYRQNLAEADDPKMVVKLTDSGVSLRYNKALKLIKGGYKDLLEHKAYNRLESKYEGIRINEDGKAEPVMRKKSKKS